MLNPSSSNNVASGNDQQHSHAMDHAGCQRGAASTTQKPPAAGGCVKPVQPSICGNSVSVNVSDDLMGSPRSKHQILNSSSRIEVERPSYASRTRLKSALGKYTDFCSQSVLQSAKGAYSKLDLRCVLSFLVKVYRRQRQIVFPFIWGILVGITMTAVLFQQHILFRGAIPWPADGKALIVKDQHNNSLPIAPHIQTRGPETVSVRAVQQHLKDTNLGQKQGISSAEVCYLSTENITFVFPGFSNPWFVLGRKPGPIKNTHFRWSDHSGKIPWHPIGGRQQYLGDSGVYLLALIINDGVLSPHILRTSLLPQRG